MLPGRSLGLHKFHTFQQGSCTYVALRSLNRQRRAAVAAEQNAVVPDLQQQFDDLSSLLSPECLVKADFTQLGRGLVVKEGIPKGSRVLSIDVFNLLCVTDEPLRTNAFGSAALSDWQILHGDLPPQLAAYLTSSELGKSGSLARASHPNSRGRSSTALCKLC
jgi:hypothetical protein